MNNIENRIWDYLDGSCTDKEAEAVKHLIESDPLFKAKYEELKALEQDLNFLELDEPSMGFTRNIMESIQHEPVPGSIKSAIDKRIINGIAGFFILTIASLLIILLLNTNWSEVQGLNIPDKIKNPEVHHYLNSTVIKGFLFFDLVLVLFFVDSYFRKKLHAK